MSAIERLKAEVLADKKKVILLGSLGAIALALGARALFSGGPGRPKTPRVTQVSNSTMSSQAVVVNTIDAETRFRSLADALPAPVQSSPASRDLFALDPEHFPHASEPEPPQEQSAKSAPQTDDDALRREALLRDAETIRLKSTLVGDRPVAVFTLGGLAGKGEVLVRPGDTVNGFLVVSIKSQRVVLERDGERIERVVRSPLD